ncbi:cupin domain-containing protein [Prolixibacteraceae bacterium JC049]|nr:cupin domain-containing protein [Prolixibacteraceae bacterium JC049]
MKLCDDKTIACLIIIFSVFIGCVSTKKITKTEVVTLVKSDKSWDGMQLPKYATGNPEITILKITIPSKTKLKWHKHPYINAGVLLKGKLTVVSENKDTLYLKANDPIVEVVNTWHYGVNEGKEPAEIIVFYAGVKEKPITVLDEVKPKETAH